MLGVFGESPAQPQRLAGGTLTLQGPGGQEVLVHVVHVLRHEEMLGRGPAPLEAGVQVERRGQRGQARVADDGEPGQDLYLLPAVEPLPQGGRHLTQRLPVTRGRGGEERRRRMGSLALVTGSCMSGGGLR